MTSHNKNSEKGFTLIEVMVVIIILGILASIVGVKVIAHIDEARTTQAQVQIEAFKTALESYRLKNSYYPSTEQGLQALVTAPTTGKLPQYYPEGGYLDKIPKDPWGNDYNYMSPGLHNSRSYDIWSYGADNEEGGEGKDADINSWDSNE